MSIQDLKLQFQSKEIHIKNLQDELKKSKLDLDQLGEQLRNLLILDNLNRVKERIISDKKLAIIFIANNCNDKEFDKMIDQYKNTFLINVSDLKLVEGKYEVRQIYNKTPDNQIEDVKDTDFDNATVIIDPKIKDYILYWYQGNIYDGEDLDMSFCEDMPEPDYELFEDQINWGDWDSYPILRIKHSYCPTVYVTPDLYKMVKI